MKGSVSPSGKKAEKDIKCDITLCEDVLAPVEQGQKLGEISLSYDGNILASSDIIAQKPIPKASVFDIFLDMINYFLIL